MYSDHFAIDEYFGFLTWFIITNHAKQNMYQHYTLVHILFFRLGLKNIKTVEFFFRSEDLQISLYTTLPFSHFFFLIFVNSFILPKVSDKNSSKNASLQW